MIKKWRSWPTGCCQGWVRVMSVGLRTPMLIWTRFSLFRRMGCKRTWILRHTRRSLRSARWFRIWMYLCSRRRRKRIRRERRFSRCPSSMKWSTTRKCSACPRAPFEIFKIGMFPARSSWSRDGRSFRHTVSILLAKDSLLWSIVSGSWGRSSTKFI